MHGNPKPGVLQLKITLRYSKPPIWRRIQIPADATFLDLHAAIQDSFGWEDYHLHHFIFGKRFEEPVYIGPRNPDDWGDNFNDGLVEKETLLKDWFANEGMTCIYEYDFGDSWDHEIKLEKKLPADTSLMYPCCIAGKRACPPEDAGGIPGYMEKLDILKRPEDEYYWDIKEWMGDFDPEHFNPKEIVFVGTDKHDLENWEE